MKILVLSQSYPSKINEKYMAFVHSRNVEYIKLGHNVDVLNFSCEKNYKYDGVNVLGETDIIELSKYDIVLSHAPNLKNHIRYILKNLSKIK